MSEDGRKPHTVGACLNTVKILKALAASEEPMKLVQISKTVDALPSTCLNLLRTLADEDFVEHDPATKSYALGKGLFDIVHDSLLSRDNRSLIIALLDKFSRRHRVSVMLWKRFGDKELTIIEYSASGAIVQIRPRLGMRVPLLTGSMGRIIAGSGELDEATLRERFSEIQWHQAMDFEDFMQQAREARSRGWSADSGTMDSTRSGISSAIPHQGSTEYIVSVAILADQVDSDQMENIGCELVQLARSIGEEGVHL